MGNSHPHPHDEFSRLVETADQLLGALADYFLDRATLADFTPEAHERALEAVRQAADELASALRDAKEADRG